MDRKALAYSGLLLISLVIVSVLVSRGNIRAVYTPGDVFLTTTSTTTTLGSVREIHGTVLFDFDEALISGVQLIVDRTAPDTTTTLDIFLPLDTSTTSTLINTGNQPSGSIITGTVQVEWMFSDVVPFDDIPGTLPGSTLPELCPDLTCGGKFKGISAGSHIIYWVRWTVPTDASYVGDYSAVLNVHTDVPGGPDIITSAPVTFPIAAPTFTVSSDTVTEGVSANLIVTLNPTSTGATSVTWNTADGTAETADGDYTAVGATVLNFGIGQATTSIMVATLDDSLDEVDETILIQLSLPTGGQSVIGGGGTVTINDDNDDPPLVSMTAATQSVTEATTTISVQVDLSVESGLPIVVTYIVTDGSATGGGVDYTGTSPITIDAGDMSGNITVDIHGDLDYEDNETFTVGITGATTTDQTVTTTAATTTVVTINNDDAPTATNDPTTQPGASYTVDEDAAINVTTSEGVLVNDSAPTTPLTAVLVSPPSDAASFTLNPDGSFDYQHDGSENATDTFTYNAQFAGAGAIGPLDSAAPATVTITVTPANDAPVANNDFFAVLPGTELTVPAPGVLGAAGNGLDTDAENDNLTAVNLSFTPAGTVTSSSLTLNPNGSFTYNPGDFVGTQTFTYQAQDDSAIAPTNALSNVATVTLSQGPTLILTVTDTTVDEDQSQFVLDITLVNPSSTPSTADVKTVDGTANSGSDFGAPSAPSISLSTANTTTAVTINVINDTATPVREGDEWFYATLSNPGGGAVIAGGPGHIVTSTLTISDPADIPTASVTDLTVNETGSVTVAEVVVTLTGRTLLGGTVDWRTIDVASPPPGTDAAKATDDYTSVSGTLTFAANTSALTATQNVQVTIVDDVVDEFDEVFAVELINPEVGKIALNLLSPLFIPLDEQNSSDVSGWAKLEDNGSGGTIVTLNIASTTIGALTSTLVHIHSGDCSNLGGVVNGLTSFVGGFGSSVTTLAGVSLSSLRTGGLAINSHSSANAGVYTTCGEIPNVSDAHTFRLEELNNSGQWGYATLSEDAVNGTTDAVLWLNPGTLQTELVHIHNGQCGAALGGVAHALTSFVGGSGGSVTSVGVTFDSLLDGGFAINTHEKDNSSNYTACGNVASGGQVTIVDTDLAPVLQIWDPAPVIEGSPRLVTVNLVGASSRGVTVDVMPVGGTATPDSDYTSSTQAVGPWAADESGTKQFTVTTLGDGEEEPAESVILKLLNASSTGAEGVVLSDTNGVDGVSVTRPGDGVQADATAVLQIDDDEHAMKVVTVVSDPEGMPGDPYFLVFTGVPVSDPGVTAIGSVPELLQKAYGLDDVRSKPATHVFMGMVSTSDPLGVMIFNNTISGQPVSTTLDVVGKRTNRSFYLSPGANYTGLALVPDDPSIASQLLQTVPNANQALIDGIKAKNPDNTKLDQDVVTLEDVVATVWAFSAADTNPTWKMYNTDDPLFTGATASDVDTLTDFAPFQGTIVMTRSTAMGPAGLVSVFDEATASPTLYPVPVRLDIEGPFLQDGNAAPVSTILSKGFNLIAPHLWASTPFDTVFAGSGGDITEIFGTAVTRERALAFSDVSSVAVIDRWLTESASIPPFVPPGTIFPDHSWWIKVAATVAQDPVISATGPSVGGP